MELLWYIVLGGIVAFEGVRTLKWLRLAYEGSPAPTAATARGRQAGAVSRFVMVSGLVALVYLRYEWALPTLAVLMLLLSVRPARKAAADFVLGLRETAPRGPSEGLALTISMLVMTLYVVVTCVVPLTVLWATRP